jgi:hypothetical protein
MPFQFCQLLDEPLTTLPDGILREVGLLLGGNHLGTTLESVHKLAKVL